MAARTILFESNAPGFIFGGIGKLLGGVARTVGSLPVIRNTPVGVAARVAGTILPGAQPSLPAIAPTPALPPVPTATRNVTVIQPSYAGGTLMNAFSPAVPSTGRTLVPGGGDATATTMVRLRKARSNYVRKINPFGPFEIGNLEVVHKDDLIDAKRRSMNPLNPKALRRANRRNERAFDALKSVAATRGYKVVRRGAS